MSTSWIPSWFTDLFNTGFTLPEGIPWLSLLLLIPLIGAIVTVLIRGKGKGAKYCAAAFSLVTMILGLMIYFFSDLTSLSEQTAWIDILGFKMNYALGIDGLSILMVELTALLVFLCVIFTKETERPNLFFAMLLAMEVGLMGVYMAQDYFLFYIFWEITLIPMFFMISWFGGPRRHYASIKFLIYTHVASLVMLIGIFALVFQAADVSGVVDFSFAAVNDAALAGAFTGGFQTLVFGLMFFGFAVKMPIVPFHTWLPDAHVEAPTAGSVLLAAVMLKMGSYGIIRICLGPALIDAAIDWQWIMIAIALISIVYGAYACIAQKDLKKMIAFSSISHMGMVMLGIAMLSETGLMFAIFQMFAHGLITAVLFMVCGIAGHNAGTREIPLLGGLAGKMPKFAGFMMFGFMASLGLPGLVGFVAEFGIIYSFYEFLDGENMIYLIALCLLGLMLTAGYYIWAMQRTLFGRETKKIDMSKVHDINRQEVAVLAVICFLIVLFGVMPSLITDIITPFVTGVGL